MVVITELREHEDATATARKAIAGRSDEEILAAVLARRGGPLPFLQAAIEVAQRRSDLFRDPSAAGMVAAMAEEAWAKAHAEAVRVRDPKPNTGNGLDLEKYSWTQQLPEVYISISVPKGSVVICEIMKNHLKVGLKGFSFIIDGELYQPVKVDECIWTIEDGVTLSILLTKQNQKEWWKSVIKGDPEVDLRNIKLSELPDLDPEARQNIEKIFEHCWRGYGSCNKW
ncbi:protein BOBBER 1-like [Oryza brachyantha]|uniref:protein BOBBER 1-like n=1 Tax=Oryza brachyantha TaxID=4533 RepID=UPI0007761E25|nr:protein BOBBER 1-like [Oryza brachyantha]